MWINNKVIGVTRCLPLIKHNGMKHVPFTHEMCHPKTVFNCFSKQTCLTTGLSTKFRGQANHLVGSSAIPEIYFATSRGLVVVSNHGGNEWARGKAYMYIYIYVYICIYIYIFMYIYIYIHCEWMLTWFICQPQMAEHNHNKRLPLATGRTRATGPNGCRWGIIHTPLADDMVPCHRWQNNQEALCALEHAVAPLQLVPSSLCFWLAAPLQAGAISSWSNFVQWPRGMSHQAPLVRRSLTTSSAASFYFGPLISYPAQ